MSTSASAVRVLSLAAIGPGDRAEVGGKAMQLATLSQRGLPVPDGFVVPVAVWRRYGREDRMPLALEAELRAATRRLGGPVAVRSSATDEDGAARSFAGQHATVLEVDADGIVDAVRTVWASLHSEAALAYRGGDLGDAGMAVLVQRMVAPRSAGVMFTVNPLNGSWREMVVEATHGLAEPLVSGQIAPHWYLVRRPRRAPRPVQRALARVRLQLMQEDLPPIDGRTDRTLETRELFRVCRLGLRVEALLGEPQDVEWALDHAGRVHVLQARPITTTGTPRVRTDVLWTRRFIGERWPEPATPLGWSVIAPLLEWFIAYPRTQARYLGGGPPLRLVHSRPYLNVTVFRHLAFKLPGAPPPRFMLELIPPEEEAEWRRKFAVVPDFAVYASIFRETFAERRWRRFRFNPWTNHTRWDEFLEAQLRPGLKRVGREPASRGDALRLVDEQIELVREYITVHVTSLLFANLWFQLLEAALASWLPAESSRLLPALAVCPPGNRTLETNLALWELAQLTTDADLDVLDASDVQQSPFFAALPAFLDAYGQRSTASWEILTPRWRDDPALLVPLLKAQRSRADPSTIEADQQARFEAAHAEVRQLLRGERTRGLLAEMLVHYTRRYLLLRENQRFWFDHLLFAMQRTFLWLGRDLGLDEPDDVAFLTLEELQGVARGAIELDPDWIARRKARRAEDLALDPPVFLRGDEGIEDEPVGTRLQGLGVSGGRIRGRVRLIRSLKDGDALQPGEILVARAVDPGWTPLLASAGGIVLELGGLLSHGAVVAREYGLPAVVNIDGALRRLQDGQEVTLDGTRGTLWIHV